MLNNKIQILLNELENDNRSGASELIQKALEIIKSQLEIISNEMEDIKDIIIELSIKIINSRPSMAPLINTIGYLIGDLELITKKNILQKIEQFLADNDKREKSLENEFQTFMAKNYKQNLKIMLISYSSTIINLLINLKGFNIELYVLESRPLFEGHYTAEILSSYFKTHIIIDAAMGKFIDQMDLILIGIDSVLKDGSIINKIGTFPLAALSYERGIDIFAVGVSLKYNLKSHYGLNIEIKEKPIKEVYNKQISNKNLKAHNYYFDITPPKYLLGIISDLGILSPQKFLIKVKKSLPINWFKSFLNNNNN